MKILVIDDNLKHQESAREFLSGHEVTIVTSFDEAMSIMMKTPFTFEAVLTDMMMPMSTETLAPGVFNSSELVPYGFITALKATLCGAKFVAMLTDTNHHQGAMSAALDHVGYYHYQKGTKPNFEINGAKVMFMHAPTAEGRKLWHIVLADLIREETPA